MSRKLILLSLALTALFALSAYLYFAAIFLPFVEAHSVAGLSRLGSDFYPRWEGTRSLLFESLDPYGNAVTDRIQTWYYGAPLAKGSAQDPMRFPDPAHLTLLFAPYAALPFSKARILMGITLSFCSFALLCMWYRVLQLRPSQISICVLFIFGWPFVEALFLEQPSLLVFSFLSAAVYAAFKARFAQVGCFLALATIKPHLALPCIVWLISWSWNARGGKKAVVWFGAISVMMLAASEGLIRGWIPEWIVVVRDYPRYTGARLSLQFLFGNSVGLVLTILLLVIASYRLHRCSGISQKSEKFCYSVAMLFALTVLLIPRSQWHNYDEVMLFPVAVYLCTRLANIRQQSTLAGILNLSALAVLIWPNIAAILLSARHLLGARLETQASMQAPTYFFFLVAPLALISLLAINGHESVSPNSNSIDGQNMLPIEDLS